MTIGQNLSRLVLIFLFSSKLSAVVAQPWLLTFLVTQKYAKQLHFLPSLSSSWLSAQKCQWPHEPQSRCGSEHRVAKGCVNCLHSTRKRSTRLLRSDCSCSGSQSSFNHCRNQCGKILARITWKKFWKRSCNKKYVFVNEQYIDKRSKMIHIINSNIFIRCINFNCLAMLASSRFKSNTNFVGHTS